MSVADKQQLLLCAETALQNLRAARDKLSSARAWGTLDLFGGGLLTSMAKHGRLNEVKACLQAASQDCLHLQNELQDSANQFDIQFDFDLGEQLKGFDIFLDNIFTDFAVQNKIATAQDQVDQLIYQVQNIIARLKG